MIDWNGLREQFCRASALGFDITIPSIRATLRLNVGAAVDPAVMLFCRFSNQMFFSLSNTAPNRLTELLSERYKKLYLSTDFFQRLCNVPTKTKQQTCRYFVARLLSSG